MLETLKIKNIAVIDTAEIPFKEGLNILSGETGAGKSIVIESIALLLGSRASAELIRSGCEEAVIEGLFDIGEIPWIRDRLSKHGFECEGDELLIKRVVHHAGRHRIYVNGELATLSILQDVCEGLIDLCGQHEHQSLIKPATQLDLLDRYGSLSEKTKGVGAAFNQLKALAKERDALQTAESERAQRADYLAFQVNELSEAALESGEDERLHAEKQLLQSAESRISTAEAARQILESEEDGQEGVLVALQQGIQKLRGLGQIDERVQPMVEGLERALAECEDVSLRLNRYLGGVDLDPERLSAVQERLSLIADLRRKYGASVDEMIATLEKLQEESRSLGAVSERLEAIQAEVAKAESQLRKLGLELSKQRRKAAALFADSVTGELKDLKMGDAKFMIELEVKSSVSTWTAQGCDQIQFVVQTNRGEPAKPLNKIASGGELSRLMLAIRRVIADKGGIGVYLFDEIDAGIGGQTAFQVGKKLKSVAAYNQVICITHLPQVASFAHHHLVVRKRASGSRTVTEVAELDGKARKEELARMLGGPELTKKSLENAAELISLAQ